MQRFVVGVIFHGQEAAFRIGHLAEVVFDEFGEVASGLDLVQGTETAWLRGGFVGTAIAEGGGHLSRSGEGAFLTGGDVGVAGVGGPGCHMRDILFFASRSFTLVAKSFGFQTVDLLFSSVSVFVTSRLWSVMLTIRFTCSGVRGERGMTAGAWPAAGGGVEDLSAISWRGFLLGFEMRLG